MSAWANGFASSRQRPPARGTSLPSRVRTQPPFDCSWFSHSLGEPTPGLVSTLLNQAYSTPSREVHTFLQVIEQVWQPMHLSRFITMAICARTFMTQSPLRPSRVRSEEHTSELQSLMRISYAVFCFNKKKIKSLILTQLIQH